MFWGMREGVCPIAQSFSILVTSQERKRTCRWGGKENQTRQKEGKKVALGTRDETVQAVLGKDGQKNQQHLPYVRITEQKRDKTYEGSNEACDCEPLTL